MANKTPEEERREAAYQRDLGKQGKSTGHAANTPAYRDYLAQQAKKKRDDANDKAFIESAKKTAGTGGCTIIIIIGTILSSTLLTLGYKLYSIL